MTPHKTMSLGKQLNHWRQEKGWTIGQLSLRSGISKASLSRWEAERTQPRVRELEAVLEALDLPEIMRVAAFSDIHSVRVVTRVLPSPERASLNKDSANLPCGELPRTGALLRAMRVRTGRTQWEIAALLGVHQSSIARWETSVESPTEEHLHTLCALLYATAEEIETLRHGPFIRPSASGLPDRSEAERRHDQLQREAVFGTWSDADLAFFQLEADLWPSAQTDAASLDLLMEVYATHARFLVWGQRHAEARQYLDLLRRQGKNSDLSRNGLPVPVQTGLLLEAEPVMQSSPRSLSATLHRLKQQQALITHLEHQAWLYMTMAEGYAILGRADEAKHFCAKGIATPMPDGNNRSGDPATLLFRATMYNHIGQYERALVDMECLPRQILTPAQQTKAEVVRASAFAALGDIPSASEAVRAGYNYVETFRTMGYKTSLDTIASML